MPPRSRIVPFPSTPLIVLLLLAAGCSTGENDSITDPDLPTSIVAATLSPVMAVDAGGSVMVRNFEGFLDDRLDAEVRIDAAAFATLDIDVADEFDDETIGLYAGTPGAESFVANLSFTEDLRTAHDIGVITFTAEIEGGGVPVLLRGDTAWVDVNGHRALGGTFSGTP